MFSLRGKNMTFVVVRAHRRSRFSQHSARVTN
jgi:hypothetical protein